MAVTPQEFDYFKDLIYKKSGIVLEAGKEYLVDTRMAVVMRKHNIPTLAKLIEALRSSPVHPLHKQVQDAMTTNETSFFRDLQPFEALRKNVLPALISSRSAAKSLNIWCAASSTGQEPYTICMTIREHFPQLRDWRIQFLATDLSQDVLCRARDGIFTQLEVNRGLPAPMLVKYFNRAGIDWQIKPEIRAMVDFRELNLTEPLPAMLPLDIVFIRNVLIYFNAETKKTILGKIRRVLKPDGYLFLGGAETTLGLDDSFHRAPFDRSGCYQLQPAGSSMPAAKAA